MKIKLGTMVLESSKITAVYLNPDGVSGVVFPSGIYPEEDSHGNAIGFEGIADYGLFEDLEGFIKVQGEEGTWLFNREKLVGMDYDEEEGMVLFLLEGFDFETGRNVVGIDREDEEMFKRAKLIYEEWIA